MELYIIIYLNKERSNNFATNLLKESINPSNLKLKALQKPGKCVKGKALQLTFTNMSATWVSRESSANTVVSASIYQDPRLVLRMAAVPEKKEYAW